MNFRIALLFLVSAVFALTVAGILTGEENIQEADLWARSRKCAKPGQSCNDLGCCSSDTSCICKNSMNNCICKGWI
uniref:U58-Deinotoxin-Dsu1b_2 n=1 Tax=Deinopis subrufa TaxID=1905329 RepID=A0A4V2H9V4_DEISU